MLFKLFSFAVISFSISTQAFSSDLTCEEGLTALYRHRGTHKKKNHCFEICKHADTLIQARRNNYDDREPAFLRRVGAACLRDLEAEKHNITKEGNGDETEVCDFAAQFTKGLEHSFHDGLLTEEGKANYKKLLKALKTENQNDFNAIVRAAGAIRKFTNPQGAFTFSLEGKDSSLFSIENFPKLSTPEGAAQIIEVYLMDLCRDVPFSDYGSTITEDAAKILNDLGRAYPGPRNAQGGIDETVLFRGTSYGNLIGPYLSQFLLQPLGFIPKTIFPPALGIDNLPQEVLVMMEQRYPIASTQDFGIEYSDFIALQNGKIPQPYQYSDYDPIEKRYIITGRDLANYVHCDGPYQAYYNALTILFNAGFSFSKASPYSNGTIVNEDPFVSFGFFDVFGLVGTATTEAGKAAWAQKWRAHRVLRPEAYAGLIQNTQTTGKNPFNLDPSIFNDHSGVNLLSLVYSKNKSQGAKTYLLGLAYPEGSPLHPSYPSGHATIAGACITVIKAFMNDTAKLSSLMKPVKPDPHNPTQLIPLSGEGEDEMTVASELDKLAFNIASGRNFSGVHYRADGEQGIRLGESVAIDLLKDHAVKFTEQTFTGFELTKIDGQRIRITAEGVFPL